jgi:hypothetical protein
MEHIVKLPLGFAESFGSGKLRKIVNESSAATETYLAHQLPDRANAIATPCGLLVLLFAFDWRLGLLSLVPVVLGFLIMMAMTGKQMQEKMKEYQNALDDMSNEAVEYVRGIPVVKTFGQTIFSFKKFKDSIDRYKVWVIAYTKQLRTPMMFYTAAINGVFATLIAGGLLLTQDGVTSGFLLDLIFYIIITPVISVTLTRIMFQSENAMIVDDALQRIDSVLHLKPLEETKHSKHPQNASVELKSVHFSYDGEKEVLKDISPIIDYTGNLVLEFFDYYMEDKTKYTVEEAKERDATYSTRLHVKVRLINRETGEIKEQEIYLGDFPLMTDSGTFVINGAERVVVSQLVRSPGCYYASDYDKTGKKLYTSTVMPIRGAWLEYETDSNDIFYVRVDRTRKLPVTSLLRAIGIETDSDILELFGEEPKLIASIQKDTVKTSDEALIEIYKKLRPGELPTVEAAKSLFSGLFFDSRRYDLAKVGRYKFNKKLSLATRITGRIAATDIIDPQSGEVLVEKGNVIDADVAEEIQNTGLNIVDVQVNDKNVRVIGNGTVNIHSFVTNVDISDLHFKEYVNYSVLKSILDTTEEKDLHRVLKERMEELCTQ